MTWSMKKILLWCAAGFYVLFVFLGSCVARPFWEAFNAQLRGYGILPLYLIIIVGAAYAFCWYVFIKKERLFTGYLVIVLIVFALLSLCLNMRKREEIVHLIEFGFLAVPVYFALKESIDKRDDRLYLYLFAFCAAVGVTDETLQFFIPGRVCDPMDMFVNTMSSLTGILVIRLCMDRPAGP